MRRAIVHVGMPRTGSTSFQEVLARLRPRLASVGLAYPELAPPGSSPAADVNHHQLGQALDGRRPAIERKHALARLEEILARTRADTVVLSYEDFVVQRPHFGVPALLGEIFARHGFAMEAMIVVKPQVEQLSSAYALRAQLVAEARTFRDFVRHEGFSGRYDYHARLDPWRRATAGRIIAIPMRDCFSDAPLLARIVTGLGLEQSLGLLLNACDAAYVTNRSSGPVAIEASRRLHRMRVHKQVIGHPRLIGHFLDDAARAAGLDTEPFRGDALDLLLAVENFYAASNERFADSSWGRSWHASVAAAPRRPANELAGWPISREVEAHIERLMAETVAHFGFRTAPAWQRNMSNLVEGWAGGIAVRAGFPRWRVQ